MKGKATIELFNENNELIYKKVEYNLITDAINNLVNQNYIVNGITNNGANISNCYTPIWKNLCGLQLFTRAIDENIIIPDKNTLTYFTGNATEQDKFDGGNVYNGYFDSASSIIDKEKLDLYFVFPLNSVSGDIGSVCLTSIQGGNSGLSSGDNSIFISYSNENLQNGSTCGVGLNVPSANYIPFCNSSVDGLIIGVNSEGKLVCAKSIDDTHIQLKIYEQKTKVNFTDTFYKMNSLEDFTTYYGGTLDNIPMLELLNNVEIELINGYDDLSKFNLYGNYLYIPRKNNDTYYLYKVELGKEIKTTYQNTNLQISDVVDYKCNEKNLYITTSNYLYVVNLNEYKDAPYLFENTYTRLEVLEDNLTPIVFKDTIALLNTKNILRDEVRNIYFLTNTNIFNKNKIKFDNDCDEIISFSFNFNEPVFGIITKTGEYTTINTNVFAPSLFSINNFSNIVTKYSTVIMKIRYELTTEDYKNEEE